MPYRRTISARPAAGCGLPASRGPPGRGRLVTRYQVALPGRVAGRWKQGTCHLRFLSPGRVGAEEDFLSPDIKDGRIAPMVKISTLNSPSGSVDHRSGRPP